MPGANRFSETVSAVGVTINIALAVKATEMLGIRLPHSLKRGCDFENGTLD